MLEIVARSEENTVSFAKSSSRFAAFVGIFVWGVAQCGGWGGLAQSAESEEPPPQEFPRQEFPRQEFPRQEFPGHATSEGQLAAEILTPLENVYSIQAELHFQAEILGKKWEGRGKYAEVRSGPIPKSRLEIRSALTGAERRLVQVCDGKTVWLHDGIENADRVVKVDAVRCREAIDATGSLPLTTGLGLGGIFGLMRALDSAFHFDPPVREKEGVTTTGTLNRGAALRFLEDRGDKSKDGDLDGKSGPSEWTRLPLSVPTHVTLRFTAKSPIPNAIEYYRKAPGAPGSRLLLRLVIDRVQINETIEERRFSFTPPKGAEILDHTDRVLQEQ